MRFAYYPTPYAGYALEQLILACQLPKIGLTAWWAEPDIADAARQMRAAKEALKDKAFAAKVTHFAEEQFSPERIGRLMRERVKALYCQIALGPKWT